MASFLQKRPVKLAHLPFFFPPLPQEQVPIGAQLPTPVVRGWGLLGYFFRESIGESV